MNWIDKLRRGEPFDESEQFLYYVRGDLLGKYFAIVRISWIDDNGAYYVNEHCIEKREIDVIEALRQIVTMALRAGDDVSVICAEDPYYLGINPECMDIDGT